jgi:DUF4097 and DUF4098 domain-containing protein YvlB
MESLQRTAIIGLVVATCVTTAVSDTRKDYRFPVGPKANVSVETQYGSITVKPGSANQVVVVAFLKSDKVEVDSSQKGNRIAIESHMLQGADQQSGQVDYEVTVPPDAAVNLRSSTGPLSAEGLHGDLTFEGTTAPVDVRHVSGGHVHVKTMSGTVNLSDIRGGHVEITSISGEVHLTSVTGPLVQVNSGSGKITYDGDFGSGGDYHFTTHTGDIEALVPAATSADFSAHSVLGKVHNDLPLEPREHGRLSWAAGSSFVGTVGKAASKVVLRSLSGKIRLKLR